MNDFRPVGYIVGWLVLGLGLLMFLPMAVDLAERNGNAGAFALSAVIVTLVGAATPLACADGWRADLSLPQGFMLTVASWLAITVAATLPLMLGAPELSFTDALFETTSAMTTTGGTVIVGLDRLPHGALLWRGLVTWVGGIGGVLLAMIFLPVLNVGGMQLLRTGDFNTLGKIMPRAKEIALSVAGVYLALTLACALGFIWGGLSGFDGLVHAFGTVATGGMGNYDSSFVNFPPAVQWVGTVFMLLGAMTFVRFIQAARGEPGAVLRDSQIRAFLAIYLALCAGLFVARWLSEGPIDAAFVRDVFFNMASVISTTGYVTTDYAQWGGLSDVLFFCAMMICGCSGSTAGGPKVFRYQILLAAISSEIKRLHSPNVVHVPHFQGQAITADVFGSVMAFLMLFFLTLGLGAVSLVLLGLDPVTAITGAAACLSNVGPGLGPVIGPYGNYAALPDPAVWVCTFLMFVGRLELMAVYVLFTPAYWRA